MCATFDLLDKHLEKSNYICGNSLTIADILIFEEATNVEMYKFDITAWKNMKAWYNRVLENKVINEVHQTFRTNALPRAWALLGSAQIQHDIKLYTFITSQPCRAVMSLLAIGNIPHEEIIVDATKGENQAPEFQEKTIFGTIPALTHGEEHIGESNAMLTYLCQAFPDKLSAYYGKTLIERTRVDDILSWYQGTFRPRLLAILILSFKHCMFLKTPIKKSAYAEAEERMKGAFDKLEELLSKGNQFICGSKVTIADLLLFHETTNVFMYKNYDLSPWTKISAWFNRMLEIEEISDLIKRYK